MDVTNNENVWKNTKKTSKISEGQQIEPQRDQNGTESDEKLSKATKSEPTDGQKDPTVCQRAPRGTDKSIKGSQNDAKGRQKEAKGSPKWAKRSPKGSQGATKMHQKIDIRKKVKKTASVIVKGVPRKGQNH